MGNKLKFYVYDGEGEVHRIDEVQVVKLMASQVSRLVYVCTTPGGKFHVSCPNPIKAVGNLPNHSEMEREVHGLVETEFEDVIGAWCRLRLHSTRALVIRSDDEVIH